MSQKKPSKKRDPKAEALAAFGSNMRALRAGRGHTQAYLAEILDLSLAYISLLERGQRNPPYTTVLAIADALGHDPRDLVVGRG